MLDPNEGTELKFIASSNISGIQCTKIEKSDVVDEIAYWQNAVLCAVMGANPPFEIMKGFLNRIWANFAIDRILYVRKGVFLVRFANLKDKIQVEKRGFYFFDSNYDGQRLESQHGSPNRNHSVITPLGSAPVT